MNQNDKTDLIKLRLKNSSDEDVRALVALVEQLEKKNELLSQHVMELTQEMENVKADFGNNR